MGELNGSPVKLEWLFSYRLLPLPLRLTIACCLVVPLHDCPAAGDQPG